jgi:hypothetical protein
MRKLTANEIEEELHRIKSGKFMVIDDIGFDNLPYYIRNNKAITLDVAYEHYDSDTNPMRYEFQPIDIDSVNKVLSGKITHCIIIPDLSEDGTYRGNTKLFIDKVGNIEAYYN